MIIRLYSGNEELNEDSAKFVMNFICSRATDALMYYRVCILKLLLDLNLISRDKMINMFIHACNVSSDGDTKIIE